MLMEGMAWGARVSPEFKTKVVEISNTLGIEPSWLMACMAFETGRTFSPSVRNKWSGATGLIQFMPTTAAMLGTSIEELRTSSGVNQLDVVLEYFRRVGKPLHSLEDLYMAILWPAAIGKPNDYPIFWGSTKAYVQNKGLDANSDGKVTKGEAASRVLKELREGLKEGNVG